MAVSPDGSRLTIVVVTRSGSHGAAAITVLPMPGFHSGTRTWTFPPDSSVNWAKDLSWAAGRQQLIYAAGDQTGGGIGGNPATLDTAAPGDVAQVDSGWPPYRKGPHVIRTPARGSVTPGGSPRSRSAASPATAWVRGRYFSLPIRARARRQGRLSRFLACSQGAVARQSTLRPTAARYSSATAIRGGCSSTPTARSAGSLARWSTGPPGRDRACHARPYRLQLMLLRPARAQRIVRRD
jgi:hypothetical protein